MKLSFSFEAGGLSWPWSKDKPGTPGQSPKRLPVPTRRSSGFQSAIVDRLSQDQDLAPVPINYILRRNLRILKARAREQRRNNDYAKRYVELILKNVAGPEGILLQARVKGASGELDRDINRAIETAWKDWAEDHCDFEQQMSFDQMQRLILATLCTDGEALLMEHRGPDAGPYGYALQFLDTDLLDLDLWDNLRNGNRIRLGVEYDGNRRVVAYHLKEDVDELLAGTFTRKHHRIPANRIHHIFVPEWVGQSRGIPWLSTPLERLHMLGRYEESALTAARVGAASCGIVTTPTGDDLSSDGPGPRGEKTREIEPGMLWELEEGAALQQFKADYPRGEFAGFNKAQLKGAASGLDVSYNSLASDYSETNYSGGRTALLSERLSYKVIQRLVSRFCKRVYRRGWLPVQSLTGAIAIDGRPMPNDPAFGASSWQPPRWPWVDPEKDAKANVLSVNNLMTSLSQVIRETGRDPDELLEEIKRDQDRLAELGLEVRDTIGVDSDSGEKSDEED